MIPTIALVGNSWDAGQKLAFQDLAAALQLGVVFSPAGDAPGVAGMVGRGNLPGNLPAVPKFQFVSRDPAAAEGTTGTLEFSFHPALPKVLRGQKVALGRESGWSFLEASQPGEIAATIQGRPVWKIADSGGSPAWTVSTPAPRLCGGSRLAHGLNGETFLPLLPLFLFLRDLSPEARWQAPPLRACLVVDDPNLHAQTYGHIRFQALLQLAREQPFHAAMAMVPFDGWWTSAGAARIFRENPRALSLLVHGNNHLQQELARAFQKGGRDALVAQSLARIEALENGNNVRVDRVMAPPHGVCAPEMFSALRAGGYEGMTTNRWSLWQHNPPAKLPLDFGLHPADWLDGLPVLNRFRFKSAIGAGEFLMAALLGRPIIPYGHHQDFAGDMIHVRALIKMVNSLPVRWLSLREILETNFESYLEAGTLHLRLFSRRVKVTLPSEAASVQIEPGPMPMGQPQAFEIAWPKNRITVSAPAQVTAVPPGAELEIRALAGASMSRPGYDSARNAPVAGLRRIASEIRDRLKI